MKRVFTHLDLKWRLLGLLLLLSFLYAFWQHFLDPIQPIHECRKADSLSQALQFMKGGNLFAPKTNAISNHGYQNAAAEFPLVYFLIGNIWRIVGYHLWLAKFLSLAYLIGAIIAFRHVLLWFFESQGLTILFSALILSSPVLIYYADTLLPNVFSFASLLFAASFLFRFFQTQSKWHWFVFTCFLSLAVLIKITALVAVLSFAGAFFFFSLRAANRFYWKDSRLWWVFGSMLLAFFSSLAWYQYAIAYNAKYNATIFSTTIRPIWEVDAATRWRILELLGREHLKELMPPILLLANLFVSIFILFKTKKALFFRYWLAISLIGLFAYFLLWFWVFEVHDYYFIEALFFPLTLAALIFKYEALLLSHFKWRKGIFSFVFIWIFLNVVSFTQVAAGNQNILVKNTFLTSALVKGNWGWFYFNHQEGLRNIQEQRKDLQKIIAPTDTVFCFSDPYPNVHLTAIDRIGFSGYGYRRNVSNEAMIRRWINMGASKLLLLEQDTANELVKPYLTHCLYHQKKVMVFDLRTISH
jgi:hypothetical protein